MEKFLSKYQCGFKKGYSAQRCLLAMLEKCKRAVDQEKAFGALITAWEVSKYGVFSGRHFPVFGLNTEIYTVNLRIQSEYRKRQTRKNSVFALFKQWMTDLSKPFECLPRELITAKLNAHWFNHGCNIEKDWQLLFYFFPFLIFLFINPNLGGGVILPSPRLVFP